MSPTPTQTVTVSHAVGHPNIGLMILAAIQAAINAEAPIIIKLLPTNEQSLASTIDVAAETGLAITIASIGAIKGSQNASTSVIPPTQ